MNLPPHCDDHALTHRSYHARTATAVSGDDHAAGHAVFLRRRRGRILFPKAEPHLYLRHGLCSPTSTLAVAGTRAPGGLP